MRQPRPFPNVCKEISGRKHGAGSEAHVLGKHGRMVVATTRQVSDELSVGERVWIDRLQFPMLSNGSRFAFFVPLTKLLAPELLRKNLFGALGTLGDFGLRGRKHLAVADAVHIAHLEAVNKQPVEPGEVIGALLEGRGMCLLPIARHRAGKVHGVLGPRSRSGRLKLEGCHATAAASHRRSFRLVLSTIYNPLLCASRPS